VTSFQHGPGSDQPSAEALLQERLLLQAGHVDPVDAEAGPESGVGMMDKLFVIFVLPGVTAAQDIRDAWRHTIALIRVRFR